MGFARLYTLATPFAGSELFDVDYEQAADVMYLTHVSHPPQKLARYAEAEWTIGSVAFGTNAVAPSGLTATAYGSTGDSGYVARTYTYSVTTVDATTGQESLQSATASCTNDLDLAGHYNVVSWSAVANAVRYRLYRVDAGVYGFIGATEAVTFSDTNFGPDTGDTPPLNRQPFVVNSYPGRVALHQQRGVFGRTNSQPAAVYTTRSADIENLDTSFPAKADDAITLQLVARQVNAIEHFVSLNDGLVVLTRDSVFSITGSQDGPLSGSDVPDIRLQSYRGSSRVRPAVVDNVVFFNTVKGGAIRTLGYQFESDGYKGDDLTVYAPHFFRGYTIVEMSWAEYPTATLWCVRSDGLLVALTWQAEQNVWGWSLCTLPGGFVESVASISYNGEDTTYFVVRRTINGADRRYIERIGRTNWTDHTQAVFLDCSLTYSGTPSSGFVGFQHLEGQTVTALADGFEMAGLTVTNGRIMLPSPASTLVVGLPYESLLETLPPSSGQTPLNGRQKQVAGGSVLVLDTCGLQGGVPDPRDPENPLLFPMRDQDGLPVPLGAPQLYSGYLQLDADSLWTNDGTVVIVQDGPFPMQVLGIYPRYDLGG